MRARFPFVCLAALLPAIALAADPVIIGNFTTGLSGWSVVRIDKKIPATRFRSATIDGIPAVEAVAEKSMALLARQVNVDLVATPVLCWRWRVSNALRSADISKKKGDDQAARIYVGLKLPSSSMSLATRAKLAVAKKSGGGSVPDGVLNYVWDNRLPANTIRANVYTDRARIIVMQTGNGQAGRWVTERRDIATDIESQFKTKAGRIASIAVSSDTDNTGESVTAAFADLHMVARSAPCRF